MTLGLSFNQLAVNQTTFTVDIGNRTYPLNEPTSTNFALTGSYEVISGLHLGLNLNLYRWKLFDNVSAARAFHADAGALYKKVLRSNEDYTSTFQSGLSLSDINGAEITFTSPDNLQNTQEFPMFLRLAVAHLCKRPFQIPNSKKGSIETVVTLQYQNVLNSDVLAGINAGGEVLIYDVLALRLGYFHFSIDDFGFSNNKDRVSDVTYGFGIKLPLQKLTGGQVPFNCNIDYCSLRPASYTYSGSRLPNFRSFTVHFNWPLNEQGS